MARSGRRRIGRRVAAACVGVVALLLMPLSMAAEQTGDVFSSSGGQCFAACGAEKWFERHSEQQKAAAADCLSLLRKAQATEQQALAIRYSDQGNDRIDEFNALIKRRTTELKAFVDCANQAWRQGLASDEFASDGDAPGEDAFGSDGGDDGGGGGGAGGGTGADGDDVGYGCPPDYVNSDNPAAAPGTRYALGFSQGLRQCVADQATIQNLTLGAAAARFKQVAAALLVVAAPGVIDGVLHPPGASTDPNPYIQGREEARRLCEWGLKVSPVLIARCAAKKAPARPPPQALSPLAVALADLAWLRKLNPTGSMTNCGQVVLAVDEALAGRGALPAPPGACAGTSAAQLEALAGGSFGSRGSHADVNNAIYHAGDGARGIVLARRPGSGLGHFFNIVNHGGDVMLLDGQLGRVMSWAEYRQMGFNDFALLRTN